MTSWYLSLKIESNFDTQFSYIISRASNERMTAASMDHNAKGSDECDVKMYKVRLEKDIYDHYV
jgi:hypothetical protein